jgi:nucleotide-binding universal stress UspA family protein
VPLVFVYVRRRPWGGLGAPFHQRRLDAEMATARRALDDALAAAGEEDIVAEGEILEGHPARRVIEFARQRDARLLVLGARRRRIGRSVSRRVIRAYERPVVVAGAAAAATG